jgi:aquaporin Z
LTEGKNTEYFAHSLVIFMFEFFGTFVMVFALNASMGSPVCVGLTYYFLYLLINPFGGAHFNPAVSLAVWLNMEKTWSTFIQLFNYILAQIFGACISSMLIFNLTKFTVDGVTTPGSVLIFAPATANYSQAFVVEMFVTFIFVYSVLVVKDVRAKLFHNHGNADPKLGWYGAMTIGLSLTAMFMLCKDHTGSPLNPAVSIAQQVAGEHFGVATDPSAFWSVYMAGPIFGAILAGLFSMIHSYLLEAFANKDDHINAELDKIRAAKPQAEEKPAENVSAPVDSENPAVKKEEKNEEATQQENQIDNKGEAEVENKKESDEVAN